MKKIRVLIVDDSAIIRRLLTDALSSDSAIEVVGVAANGKIALAKIPQLKPDLVTLDIEMPEMDGLETLVEIRKQYPKLPVIMFSTLTERGAVATLDALSRGANDYVAKPCNTGSLELSMKRVREELIPKIHVFCRQPHESDLKNSRFEKELGRDSSPAPTSAAPAVRQSTDKLCSIPSRIDAVVLGTSTGGPNALTKLVADLPHDFQVPVFVVQHMPPIFTTRLAERLNQLSSVVVVEAEEGMKVEPGMVYLAPGDHHMTVVRRGNGAFISLNQEAPECSCRPAVDVLFRSAASLYGQNLLAVVLTGMGQDGLVGCSSVRKAGGHVLVQDKASSVVWGMPKAVQSAGLAHETLPLEAMAGAIQLHTRRGRRSIMPSTAGALT